jgi:A/G-specific adenine glycosylase
VKVASIRQALLSWYDVAARDLPFRRTRDPYAIWVAEVMLQQTRVETVLPYYERFLSRWPSAQALADAPLDDVLAAWSGLGYYRRARLLHAGARHVRDVHGGTIPDDLEAIRAIPGVGAYTSGAIASQAFDRAAPLVDGNVARVLARVAPIETDVKKGPGLSRAWQLAGALVEGPRPGALNNALMELGATICVPREPRCLLCPIAGECEGRRRGIARSLPIVTEKKARPRIVERAVILREGTGIVLVRRSAAGLFAGLWEPPRVTAKSVDEARAAIEAILGVEIEIESSPVRTVEHVLTHRHLEITVHEGRIARRPSAVAEGAYDAVEIVAIEGLGRRERAARGMATLGRKILGLR